MADVTYSQNGLASQTLFVAHSTAQDKAVLAVPKVPADDLDATHVVSWRSVRLITIDCVY